MLQCRKKKVISQHDLMTLRKKEKKYSKIPWAIQLCKNQVCHVNGSRDRTRNVLRMRKRRAKIWGALKIPWAIHICKHQVSNPSGSRVIARNVLRMRKRRTEGVKVELFSFSRSSV
ncbi:hypothetical protein AVEN_267633-1 [Araneus ventricosus]|uniref:Uncharacterized protein n=1 Tax=Araneus ventricosus TaxID=182803 RepID=A0A4Y2PK42_ARAVE|nr:hypothetical protein AVEN_267633-1 [Araneus ventricosus]